MSEPRYQYLVQRRERRRLYDTDAREYMDLWSEWGEWDSLSTNTHSERRPWPTLGGARVAASRYRGLRYTYLRRQGELARRVPYIETETRIARREVVTEWEVIGE